MSNAYQRPQHARYNNFHGPKKALIGHPARQVPPSWRPNAAPPPPGSKILISRLPIDVGLQEVEELFRKTVGPLRDVFLVYNSQGHSKGMAIVAFQRKGDAAVARAKYHGKVVDGRRPILIEIIVDDDAPSAAAPAGPPSLIERIGGVTAAAGRTAPKSKKAAKQAATSAQQTPVMALEAAATTTVPPRRVRARKGARRLQKRATAGVGVGGVGGTGAAGAAVKTQPKTKEQLDQEMEDYRAAASS
ncbi:hypothetical protein GGG16DRAFT_108962 [Schizophyllum commune]